MKNRIISFGGLALFLMMGHLSLAQSFHKNSITMSMTGGSTRAMYFTKEKGGSDFSTPSHHESMTGMIDPLIIEFGISDRFGIGFTGGSESYKVDAERFYDYKSPYGNDKLMSTSSYCTFDLNYHPYITGKFDLSISGSIGSLKIKMDDYQDRSNSSQEPQTTSNSGENTGYEGYHAPPVYSYFAKGTIVRTGVRARYYFWKGIGVMAMVNAFTGKAHPRNTGEYSFGNSYSTGLVGVATEFGLCFRFY